MNQRCADCRYSARFLSVEDNSTTVELCMDRPQMQNNFWTDIRTFDSIECTGYQSKADALINRIRRAKRKVEKARTYVCANMRVSSNPCPPGCTCATARQIDVAVEELGKVIDEV